MAYIRGGMRGGEMNAMNGLKDWLLAEGASLVGFADLRDLPGEFRANLPMGISLAAALDRQVLADAAEVEPDEPTPRLRAEYGRKSEVLKRLFALAAERLNRAGFRAMRPDEVPGNYDGQELSSRLSHKRIATQAGLGWIGTSGLLVTRPFGPAVRLWSILTDAPLPADEPVSESGCPAECDVCAEACPAGAIRGERWRPGRPRQDLLDPQACRRLGLKFAERRKLNHPTCGRCIVVCPLTRVYVQAKA